MNGSKCYPGLLQQSSCFSWVEIANVSEWNPLELVRRCGCSGHLLGVFTWTSVPHFSLVSLAEHVVILVLTNVKHELCWRSPQLHCDQFIYLIFITSKQNLVHLSFNFNTSILWHIDNVTVALNVSKLNFNYSKMFEAHFNSRVPLVL